MSTIKHYDGTTWQVDAAGNARNIELSEAALLDTDTTSISVERGFQKLNNKISKLEHNLAWIYQNGAKGGSGGGGGSGSGGDYSITIKDGQTDFYTSSSTVEIPMMINSGNSKKTFYVTATDGSGKTLVDSESHNSLSYFNLTIKNVTADMSVILQAHDSNDNYTSEVIVKIHWGALNLIKTTLPDAQYILGGNSNTIGIFTALNKTGKTAELRLYNTQASDFSNLDPINTWSVGSSNSEQIYSIDFKNYMELNLGNKYNFKLVLYSESLTISSTTISCNISVVSGTTLALLIDGIGTSEEYATDVAQGAYVSFKVTPSYQPNDITEFDYSYIVYKGEDKISEYTEGTGLAKNVESIISFSTSGLELGIYKLLITVSKSTQTASAEVYFNVAESSSGDLRWFKGQLLASFGPFDFAQSTTASSVTYTIPTSGDYYFNSYPASNGTKTTLNLHNNTTSNGFIIDNIKYISLTGNTYATIDRFSEFFPNTSLLTNSIFSTGFYIQCTYKYNTDDPQDQTVLSLGTYKNGDLYSGFEINSDYITLKFGEVDGFQVETPITGENYYTDSDKKTSTVTIGLRVWSAKTVTSTSTLTSYYFALYIDGVMTKCTIIPQADLQGKWNFADSLYLGCRSDLSNQANCKIYDFEIYVGDTPGLLPVYNWMAAIEQAHLLSGVVDSTLDSVLRKKNLFSQGSNSCLLCDSDGNYLDASVMYSFINDHYSEYDLDYPVVYLSEVDANSDMYQYVKATWDAKATNANGTAITKINWDVNVNIKTKYGTLEVKSSEQDTEKTYSPKVAIQGTSSLSYNSKNFELNMGYSSSGEKRLLKINNWLPEFEFTLKADVVDSAHVNNVAIGTFLNSDDSFFPNQYPKATNDTSLLASKIKKTSEGFPCLVFIKFGADGAGKGATEFMGVYNFNLGRYAYNNLGMQTLKEYTEDKTLSDDAPQLIETYSYTTKSDSQYVPDAYSLEVEDNFGDDELLFRQAHLTITEYMLSNRSPTYGDNEAFTAITNTLYNKLAQSFTGDKVEQKLRNDDGTYSTVLQNGAIQYWAPDTTNLTYEALNTYISMPNLYAYYVTAVVFGLVDSMCKNLVLRSWDGKKWTPAFYDMDTAFKMDNRGSDSTAYDAHPNRYYNTYGTYTEAGNGTTEGVVWCPSSDSVFDDWTFAFAGTHNNRLWEILQSLDNNGNDATRTTTISDTYWTLRQSKLQDPDAFIDTYYAGYINKTGAIMYNYDYQQKYVDYSRTWDADKGFIADTSSKQTSFLYGTRISTVRKWFKKRIQFLDSVYMNDMPTLSSNVVTNVNSSWNAGQTASSTITTGTIAGSQRCKIRYSASSGTKRSIWIDETPRNYNFETQSQGNLWNLEGNKLIKSWSNFNKFGWSTAQQKFKFPYLTDFTISGLTIKGFASATPLYDNGEGLCNVRTIDMSNLTLNPVVSVDFSGCESLQSLNLSGCNIQSFTLPTNGSLQVLDLTDTSISAIPTNDQNVSVLNGQSGLTDLYLSGTKITNLKLENLPSLTNLTLPSTLESLTITNCNINELVITWSSLTKLSSLTSVTIDNCKNLSTFNLNGQNNLSSLQLTNCPSLVTLNLGSITAKDVNIHTTGGTGISFAGLTKLQTLDISDTTIFEELDLEDSADLCNINCSDCTSLVTVKCAYNADNLIELPTKAFNNCSALETLYGYFDIQGSEIFENCNKLQFETCHNAEKLDFEFHTASVARCFRNCKKLETWYRSLISKFPPSCTNAEECFSGSGITGIFAKNTMSIGEGIAMGLTNTNSMFADTGINGSISENLWEYLPNLLTCERMFANTNLNYIDNDFFKGCINLTNVDYMFSGCKSLTAVVDADLDTTEQPLHSKNFFIDLIQANSQHSATTTSGTSSVKNPSYIYPFCVFKDTGIKMTVDVDDNGRPYLFHTAKDYREKTKNESGMLLNNYLYDGIDLIYEPDTVIGTSSLFEPGTRGDYFVPYFVSISSPFTECSIKIDLSKISGEYFLSNTYLKTLEAPFNGMTLTGTLAEFLNYSNSLTTISYLFKGVTADFEDDIYEFTTNFFGKCTALINISNIFADCTIPMKLCSNMFQNCSKLTNISQAFSNSRVVGSIPEKWLQGTNINNMSGVFSSCWNLGYSTVCSYLTEDTDIQKITWSQHYIVKGSAGTKIPNYSVPTDLFDYCQADPNIDGVLGDFFYKTRTATLDEATGKYDLENDVEWFGPTSQKITKDFFKSGTALANSTKLIGVFKNTHFAPYIDFNNGTRGQMYPDYLFENIPNLTDISYMFYNTEIYQACDINKTVIYTGTKTVTDSSGNTSEEPVALPLVNISNIWAYCLFHTDYTDSEGNVSTELTDIDQLDDTIFKPVYTTLRNCSYAFAGNSNTGTGIPYISSELLALTDNTSDYSSFLNIDYMFFQAPLVKACEAPIFNTSEWHFTGNPGTYLQGIESTMISNADTIKATGIYPTTWDLEDEDQ